MSTKRKIKHATELAPDPGAARLQALAQFYSDEVNSLLTKYRHIENLIGKKHHSTSEGDYCEVLLKELLRRTIPRRFSIDTGFVHGVTLPSIDTNSEGTFCTPQLDIIIHDVTDFPPLFRSEDFVIVMPDAVRAVIEVKKTLTHSSLNEAASNLTLTRSLLRRWSPNHFDNLFTGICAFALDDGLKPQKGFSDSFKNCYTKTVVTYKGLCECPSLLVVLSEFALVRRDPSDFKHPIGFYKVPSVVTVKGENVNIAGQILLLELMQLTKIASIDVLSKAMAFPEGTNGERIFEITQSS